MFSITEELRVMIIEQQKLIILRQFSRIFIVFLFPLSLLFLSQETKEK